MTITKLGHCCLLIEIAGKRVVTDPGVFTAEAMADLTDIDLILISHEHADHLHAESLHLLLEKNPQAIVITNSSVGRLLAEQGIAHEVLEGQASHTYADVPLHACDGEHVEIFADYGIVQNTGYLVADSFFYPGDAYTEPGVPVSVLALPVAGPWCKVSDAIRYALRVAPKTALPVHDAVLSEAGKAVTYPHCARELTKAGIEFIALPADEKLELPD